MSKSSSDHDIKNNKDAPRLGFKFYLAKLSEKRKRTLIQPIGHENKAASCKKC